MVDDSFWDNGSGATGSGSSGSSRSGSPFGGGSGSPYSSSGSGSGSSGSGWASAGGSGSGWTSGSGSGSSWGSSSAASSSGSGSSSSSTPGGSSASGGSSSTSSGQGGGSSTSTSSGTSSSARAAARAAVAAARRINFISLAIAAVVCMAQLLLYPIYYFSTSTQGSEPGALQIRQLHAQLGMFSLRSSVVVTLIVTFLAFTVVYISLVYVPRFAQGKQRWICYVLMLVVAYMAVSMAAMGQFTTSAFTTDTYSSNAILGSVPLFIAGIMARTAQDVFSKHKVLGILLWLIQVVALVMVDLCVMP